MPVPTYATTMDDAFSVLGLADDASAEEIKLAYKKMALKWHPDRHLDDKDTATQHFIEIHDAYRRLTEPSYSPSSEPAPNKSPGPKHAKMSTEGQPPPKKTRHKKKRYGKEDSTKSPESKHENMTEGPSASRKSPRPAHATMTGEQSRPENQGTSPFDPTHDEGDPQKSPGQRHTAMPRDTRSKKSPGPRFATVPDEEAHPSREKKSSQEPQRASISADGRTQRSPGPRHSTMPHEHDHRSKKSTRPRHATTSTDSQSKKFPGPHHTPLFPDRRFETSPRPRFATMPGNMPSAEKEVTWTALCYLTQRTLTLSLENHRALGMRLYPVSTTHSRQGFHHDNILKPLLRVRDILTGTHTRLAKLPRTRMLDTAPILALASDSESKDYVHVDLSDIPLTPPPDQSPPPSGSSRHIHASQHKHHHSHRSRGDHAHAGGRMKEWLFPLDVTLEELYHGTTQRLQIARPDALPHTHTRSHHDPHTTDTVDVVLPPGTLPGTRFPVVLSERRITFVINELPHTHFNRIPSHASLYSYDFYDPMTTINDSPNTSPHLAMCVELPYSLLQDAEYGMGEPNIPTPPGSISVQGPSGAMLNILLPSNVVEASDGTYLRGQGMPIYDGAQGKVVGYGDLFIRWDLFIPGHEKRESKWNSIKKAMQFTI
ncbi:hypothetical protein EW146_g2227 [Bondarzewia mesenterica]|uniref:J domain-containing protein n=1 Tax=Bondarzewia mesenterica TaxID=1095465 RepID=A0A4V3XFU1_9AGAM|nr:hypothetical protein EW146_g2227 [Bondarzewia mesenterica]